MLSADSGQRADFGHCNRLRHFARSEVRKFHSRADAQVCCELPKPAIDAGVIAAYVPVAPSADAAA